MFETVRYLRSVRFISFGKNHFIGPTFDINYTKGKEESEGVAEDPYYQEYNDRPLNTGVGVVYQFDSRDMAVNAYEGFYLELMSMFYTKGLGDIRDRKGNQGDRRII